MAMLWIAAAAASAVCFASAAPGSFARALRGAPPGPADIMRNDDAEPLAVKFPDGVVVPNPVQPNVVPGNPFDTVAVPSPGEPVFGRCPSYDLGTVPASESLKNFFSPVTAADGGGGMNRPQSYEERKAAYYANLKRLNIEELYHDVATLMTTSQDCWPADGPQNGDTPSYAGLFERLAWHCSGTFRIVDGIPAGGCEGGRQRFWPENEWHDNVNLDKARALLAPIMEKYGDSLSAGDLYTFAGTVAILASGGPAHKFCFGRVDDIDGRESVRLSIDGVNGCTEKDGCVADTCATTYQFPEQDPMDYSNCNATQQNFRFQGSHAVGLIYVHPEGPNLRETEPEVNPAWVHRRSARLSGLEIHDTFERMGWNPEQTVALIAGGHTLGRAHGACQLATAKQPSFNGQGPYYEEEPGSGRGPTDGLCGTGMLAGLGPNTVSSGFEGAWTSTPSRWNYDYLKYTLYESWEPVRSPSGLDQWWTTNRSSPNAAMMRLTSDMALAADPIYRHIAVKMEANHTYFDEAFASAFRKLMHQSERHPWVGDDSSDLEQDAQKCTDWSFLRSQ
jgi:catalase-peroxidase